MKLSVDRTRRSDLPWVMLGVLAIWVVVVGAIGMIARRHPDLPELCMLRRSTGVPCPTCGGTRAGLALLRFDPLAAAAQNPLLTLLCVVFVAWLVLRIGFGRAVRLEGVTRRDRRVMWAIGIAAVLANWAWVLHRHGVWL